MKDFFTSNQPFHIQSIYKIMTYKYFKFRIMLFALAFGLAFVPFINTFYKNRNKVDIDLPQVESESSLYVYLSKPEIDYYEPQGITPDELIQNRDLSQYNSGKTFSNCMVENSEVKICEKQRIKARNFIYSNWKNHKRAYIVYEWSGVDTGSDTHIFVEPDKNGKWAIVLRGTGDFRFQKEVKEETGIFLRYKKAMDDYPFEDGTYYLSVLDNNNREIEKF